MTSVYVFVRTDIPIEHQFVQSLHATHQMAAIYAPGHGVPNLVLIGLPDVDAMRRALSKIEQAQIPHYVWPPKSVMDSEPERTLGELTAIATAPLDNEQREVLKNYQLWKHDYCNCHEFSKKFYAESEHREDADSSLQ